MLKPKAGLMLGMELLFKCAPEFCLHSGCSLCHNSITDWIGEETFKWCGVLFFYTHPSSLRPLISPFVLRTKIQLPRDKRQKASQERSVNLGFEHDSYGRPGTLRSCLLGKSGVWRDQRSERALSAWRCCCFIVIFFSLSVQMHLVSLRLLHPWLR